jgi:hypothetical protein
VSSSTNQFVGNLEPILRVLSTVPVTSKLLKETGLSLRLHPLAEHALPGTNAFRHNSTCDDIVRIDVMLFVVENYINLCCLGVKDIARSVLEQWRYQLKGYKHAAALVNHDDAVTSNPKSGANNQPWSSVSASSTPVALPAKQNFASQSSSSSHFTAIVTNVSPFPAKKHEPVNRGARRAFTPPLPHREVSPPSSPRAHSPDTPSSPPPHPTNRNFARRSWDTSRVTIVDDVVASKPRTKSTTAAARHSAATLEHSTQRSREPDRLPSATAAASAAGGSGSSGKLTAPMSVDEVKKVPQPQKRPREKVNVSDLLEGLESNPEVSQQCICQCWFHRLPFL